MQTACAVHITYTIGCLLDRGGGEHCMRGEVCMHLCRCRGSGARHAETGACGDARLSVRGMVGSCAHHGGTHLVHPIPFKL